MNLTLTCSCYSITTEWSRTNTVDCCHCNSVFSGWIQSRDSASSSTTIIDILSCNNHSTECDLYCVASYLSIRSRQGTSPHWTVMLLAVTGPSLTPSGAPVGAVEDNTNHDLNCVLYVLSFPCLRSHCSDRATDWSSTS